VALFRPNFSLDAYFPVISSFIGSFIAAHGGEMEIMRLGEVVTKL
jgi:hypothetical protein